MKRKQWKDGKKHCASCNTWLSIDNFHKNKRNWDGLHAFCKGCMQKAQQKRYIEKGDSIRKQQADYQRKNPEKRKNSSIKSKYGITFLEYKTRYDAQDGKCKICDCKRTVLLIDHDHKSGKIRGLLCKGCNTGLGLLGDTAESVKKAWEYLCA